MLWDLNENKHLYTLDGGEIINALCFSPNRYWLCAATGPSIKIWVSTHFVLIIVQSMRVLGSCIYLKYYFVQDLECKIVVDELRPEIMSKRSTVEPQCVSLAWSFDGQTLFAGYSDHVIRVWQVSMPTR